MRHLFAHNEDNFVKEGDVVLAYTTPIGSIGRGYNNEYYAHLHCSKSEGLTNDELIKYVSGWSKETVEQYYSKPDYDFTKMFGCKMDVGNFGYDWLQWIGYGYHPGLDINGLGGGNTDLGMVFKSPVSGKVVYSKKAGKGWGNVVIIEEKDMDDKNMRIIDLSHWNKVTDWSKLKDDYIIHKCTQGTSYLDPTYNDRRDKIKASYHFANGGDPIKEADWFVKNANEKVLVLDWEIDNEDTVGWCKKFIDRVRDKTGIECWLYTNDARARKYQFPSRWIKWIARYKDYSGDLDWAYQPRADWDLWQYTSRGKVNGIEGNVDLNQSKINLETPPEPQNAPTSDEKPEELPEQGVDDTKPNLDDLDNNLRYDWETNSWVYQGHIISLIFKYMKQLKAFFASKEFETACWHSIDLLLAALITFLAGINVGWAVVILPVLTFVSKYINVNYIKK